MTIYIINILSMALYAILIQPQNNDKAKKKFMVIMFLQLLAIYSLRSYNVGWDSFNYKEVFLISSDIPDIFSFWMEFGYLAINRVVRVFTNSYNILYLLIGLIILIPIFKSIYLYSKDAMLSLFIYIQLSFYYTSMNQVRQMMAASVCVYAFVNLVQKKYLQACICTLIAMCFHMSAAVYFLFIIAFILFDKMDDLAIIILAGLLWLGFNMYPIIETILRQYLNISYFSNESLQVHIREGNPYELLVYLSIFIFCFFYRKRHILKFPHDKRLFDSFLLAAIFAIAFNFMMLKATILGRLAKYFALYSCLIIPAGLSAAKNKYEKTMLYFVIIALLIFYNYFDFFISYGRDGVVPYEFFWELP